MEFPGWEAQLRRSGLALRTGLTLLTVSTIVPIFGV